MAATIMPEKCESMEEAEVEEHERRLAKDLLSDVGTFAFAGLCAVVLSELYNDEKNRKYKTNYMEKLVKHLNLPPSVNSSMEAFLNRENPDCLESLVPAIFDEKGLNGDACSLIQDLVFLTIQEGEYDARSRVLLQNVAFFLRVSPQRIDEFEDVALSCLSQEAPVASEEETQQKQKAERRRKIRRRLIIAAAAVGGGALIGLSGGLAVPLLAAGAGAIIGGAGAAVIGSITGMAVIGSLFGLAGAGLTGFKMKKRIGEVEEFAFEDLTDGKALHITIAISGWLSDDGPGCFREPWETLALSKEQYCLRYESKYLFELGKALEYIATTALSMAAVEALKTTALAGLLSAMAFPAVLIQLAGIIDNPWCVCVRRSAEVGRVLGTTLLTKQHGKRPVTLIGYSLGARVIFYCLQEMSKTPGYEGIIEDVVLLGAPVPANPEEWRQFESVVNGRIINGYSSGDWMLKFLYRTAQTTLNIAGLQPVEWKSARMVNVDLSDIVSGHFDYSKKIETILKVLGIRTRKAVWKQSLMVKKSSTTLSNVSVKAKDTKDIPEQTLSNVSVKAKDTKDIPEHTLSNVSVKAKDTKDIPEQGDNEKEQE